MFYRVCIGFHTSHSSPKAVKASYSKSWVHKAVTQLVSCWLLVVHASLN